VSTPPLVAVGPGVPDGEAPVVQAAIAPSVVIEAEARPGSGTRVELEDWSGPLALLLTLIETRKLDVLTVPLGSLAEAYLEAIARVEVDRIGHISSFVGVAGQLILIKSRAMLPRQPVAADASGDAAEEADPEARLRERLLLYRAYRDAGMRLADSATALFRREPAVAAASGLAGAVSGTKAPPLDPSVLATALVDLVRVIAPPPPPPETVRRTITLAERARIIRAALRDAPHVVLQDLLSKVRDRVVVAVTFLAMLELMKRREIVVEQAEPFGPIVARRTTAAERAAAGLPAAAAADGDPDADPDVDQPFDESLASFA
jgi:segregation and condensation protein A